MHEGHTGFTIDTDTKDGRAGISPLTPGSVMTYQPHIITLMIGTNDVNLQNDLANAPMRLGNLLDSIYAVAPDVTIVLAQINPSQDDTLNGRITTYNAAIPDLVNTRAAAGKHIMLVDMYTAITSVADYKTALLYDMLHPNATGYAKMADVWYAALGPLLH
jgi:lysophospholipase L1-like esterase